MKKRNLCVSQPNPKPNPSLPSFNSGGVYEVTKFQINRRICMKSWNLFKQDLKSRVKMSGHSWGRR